MTAEYETSEKRNRTRLPVWGVILITVACVIIAVCAVCGVFVARLANGASALDSAGGKAYRGPGEPYIAKISIVGEIGSGGSQYASSDSAYHHDWTVQTVDALISDDDNKAIYLYLNTPGGTVYESDALYLKLMEYKEKTERPVYVYMGPMAASGGYYIASAADYIYANRNTWTGSIGVTLGTMFDVSEFLDKHGIHTDTITSGSNKAMGSYYTPLSDEQKAIYQSLVDEAYGQFVSIVAAGRALPESKVRNLADGRIYTAKQALENGLIDEILGEKEAEAAIEEKTDGAVIDNCYYHPYKNYLSLFSLLSSHSFTLSDWMLGAFLLDAGDAIQGAGEGDAASGGSENGAYTGDVAAVLDFTRGQSETGAPPLKYLYAG